MKKHIITFIMVLTTGFFFMNFTMQKTSNPPSGEKTNFEIPADIQGIIDNSCYGCHHTESKNEKGKKKLDFDKMTDLKTYKLVGKLADISDVVTEGDMPPEKAVKKYPEMKLSDEDKSTLSNWAKNMADELSK
jgi:cytochrome c553